MDRPSLANCWQAGACAGLIVCQIKGWVPLQPTEAKRATPGSGPHDGGCGGSRGRGGARSAPRGQGHSRGSVRADTWLSLQPLALYPQVAHAVGTAGAPGAQLEFAPAPGVRAVLAVCSFFWRNFESQANTFILTFLQHWATSTACQQRVGPESSVTVGRHSVAGPVSPPPGTRRARSLRGRTRGPQAPRWRGESRWPVVIYNRGEHGRST